MTAYEMSVANVARHIRNQSQHDLERHPDQTLDAFEAARVLSIAFCKIQGEVLSDILKVNLDSLQSVG